jgi:hypothetical protein
MTKNGFRVTATICGQVLGKDATMRVGASAPSAAPVRHPYLIRAESII